MLPKKQNISKSNNRLIEISDLWLKNQIETFTEIPEKDFLKYSDFSNLDNLKEFRKSKFLEAFSSKRDVILNN